jgi:pyruvate formate lyase activating enzyme
VNAPVLSKDFTIHTSGRKTTEDICTSSILAAGLQKTSLIDYPGKVACVVFLTGCNFACPYCHNPDLAIGRYPQRISLEDLREFLAERQSFLEGVVITGGEPTLHPGLPKLCHTIHDIGLAVKVDTNGSRPKVIAGLLHEALVDSIAMDIKTIPACYGPPLCDPSLKASVLQSIQLIMQSTCDYEFRTTCVRPFVDNAAMREIARTIQGAKRYVLQRFRSSNLLSPDFFKKNDPGFSEDQMLHLQHIVDPWVENCLIR